VPGRMATCSSATFAVSVRRGSTTTTRPPLRWIDLISAETRGRRCSRVMPLVTKDSYEKQSEPGSCRVGLQDQVLVAEHAVSDDAAVGVLQGEHVERVRRAECAAECVRQADRDAVRGVPPVGGDRAGAVGFADCA